MTSGKKLFGIILIVLFFICISVPFGVSLLQDDEKMSGIEKRTLAPKPANPKSIASLLNYPERFEKYFNDHFGFREQFLNIYASGKKMIGDTPGVNTRDGVATKNVIKGKEGWYFLNRVWDGDPLSDYRNIDLYSDQELARAVLALAAREDWLARRRIRYLLFFAPNKHTIYSEYLPDYITRQGNVSSLDQLKGALAKYTSVQMVDLRPVLISNKPKAGDYWQGNGKDARLYWKTDSHWNGAGADIAQFAVAQRLEKMLPGLIVPKHRPKSDFVMKKGKGDLASMLRDKNLFNEKAPVVLRGRCSKATRKEFFQKKQIATCADAKVNAIIFHDSFFTGLKPFFVDYFATTVFLWKRMNLNDLQQYIPKYKPAVVIEELAERFLPYVPDIRGESYYPFWKKFFAESDNVLYRLDGKKVAEESHGHKNVNLDANYDARSNTLLIRAANGDPYLYLPKIPFGPGHLYLLQVQINAPAATTFELFYSRAGKESLFPAPSDSERYQIGKGNNTLYVPLLSGDFGSRLRFDPGRVPGEYSIGSFEIREVSLADLQKLK